MLLTITSTGFSSGDVTLKIMIPQDMLVLGTIANGLSLPSRSSVIVDLDFHIEGLP